VHLVGFFIIRIYHDARSPERQIGPVAWIWILLHLIAPVITNYEDKQSVPFTSRMYKLLFPPNLNLSQSSRSSFQANTLSTALSCQKPSACNLPLTIHTLWSLYVPPGLTLKNSTFCPHSCIYVFCMDLRTNKALFPYTTLTGWLLKPRRSVYCAVRTVLCSLQEPQHIANSLYEVHSIVSLNRRK